MAIYHLHCEIVKRSSGHSAVAGAAYQAHQKIHDERTGEVHDYTRRKGEVETGIIAPTSTPEWVHDRAKLWNAVERCENRKDAQLARSFDMALPHELTAAQRLELVRGFAKAEFADKGMVVDYANHQPHKRKVKNQEESNNNWHVHFKVTLREIGPEGFKSKKREWNSKEQMEQWRTAWATHTNRALERAGSAERVDHRSLEVQRQEAEEQAAIAASKEVSVTWALRAAALDRPATVHMGKAASVLENRGIQTQRGDYNRQVKAWIIDLQEYRAAVEKAENVQIKSSELISRQANGQSEALPFRPLEPKATSQQIDFGHCRVTDKLADAIRGLEDQLSRLDDQRKQLEKAIPSIDTLRAYHDHATGLLCPKKAKCEVLKIDLRQQMDKWEVANFHWRDRGDREGWSLESMMPDFLKSSVRKSWEARGKELSEIKGQLTEKTRANNNRLQEAFSYLKSPQGKHATQAARDNLINADYPHWRVAKEGIEQIERQRKTVLSEKDEYSQLRGDLSKCFPTQNMGMSSKEDIRERIRRPDILHLIKLIEQVKAKELIRKKHMEMSIGRR